MTIISPLSLIIQRLQYQGWLAVVANLEDLVTDLKKTGKQMETTFDNYLGKRESYQAQIESFDDDVAVLLQVIRITENEKRTFLGKLYLADSCVPCLAQVGGDRVYGWKCRRSKPLSRRHKDISVRLDQLRRL